MNTFTPPASTSGPKRRSIAFLIVIGLFGLCFGFLFNTLDPFIYTEKIRWLALPWLKNSALSTITIMALLAALVVQPVVGRWSDHTRSRWGRRAPFLVVGVAGVCVSLVLMLITGEFWLVVMTAMLISAFANVVQGPWQALVPDQVPEQQHGTAAGIKTLVELVGVTAGVTVAGASLARGNLWTAPLVVMGLLTTVLGITLYVITKFGHPEAADTLPNVEQPAGAESTQPIILPTTQPFGLPFDFAPPAETSPGKFQGRPPNYLTYFITRCFALVTLIRAVPGFAWWMVNRVLFWSAVIAVRTFMLNYMQDVLLFSPAETQRLSSHLFLALGIGVFLLALPAGAIADRIGRHPLLVIAGMMAALGTSILIFSRALPLLYVAAGLIGAGAGVFSSSSWALATDLAPPKNSALYLGLANSASVVGSISGRLGGPLIDGLNELTGVPSSGYMLVYGLSALFFVASSLAVWGIPKVKLKD